MTFVADFTPLYIAKLCAKADLKKYCSLALNAGVKGFAIDFSQKSKIPFAMEKLFFVKAASKREISSAILKNFKVLAPFKYFKFFGNDKRIVYVSDGNVCKNAGNAAYFGFEKLLAKDYKKVFEKMLKKRGALFIAKDDYFCASALVFEWILAGGEKTAVSFNGAGGIAPLEQVLASLKVLRGENFNLKRIRELKKVFEKISKTKTRENAAVIGDKIFDVESGVHIDGIMKNPSLYQPYSPEIAGGKTRIVLGKNSGKSSVLYFAKQNGIKISKKDAERLARKIRVCAGDKIKIDEKFLKKLFNRSGGRL